MKQLEIGRWNILWKLMFRLWHFFEHRRNLISAIRFPAFLFLLMLFFSLRPNRLTRPGIWENYVLSDWILPHSHYPQLMGSATQRGSGEPAELWQHPKGAEWIPCVDTTSFNTRQDPSFKQWYLQVWLEGGLNQQRIGLCNAVALARLLNATLLLPELEVNAVWRDDSSLGDIFDVPFLIQSLAGEVDVAPSLPRHLAWSTREFYKQTTHVGGPHNPLNTRVKNAPVHASPQWYLDNVTPVLQQYGIAAIAPFTHRLAFDGLPPHIQRLRCKVNFLFLRFVPSIESLADTIVKRIRATPLVLPGLPHQRQPRTFLPTGGPQVAPKFVALHLRFDKDMVAHSSCDFGGGRVERRAVAKYREFAWQNRIEKLKHSPQELRRRGKCPLTPEEVGLMLAAMGFGNDTRLYLATFKVYGGDARMAPLRQLFPLTVDKTMLATSEELEPFRKKASHLAAIDFLVSVKSDVFMPASPGNMRNVLFGFRQYFGAKKTLSPSFSKLAFAFSNASHSWNSFSHMVKSNHKKRVGQVKVRVPTQSIYTYPAPDCMCLKSTVSQEKIVTLGDDEEEEGRRLQM